MNIRQALRLIRDEAMSVAEEDPAEVPQAVIRVGKNIGYLAESALAAYRVDQDAMLSDILNRLDTVEAKIGVGYGPRVE